MATTICYKELCMYGAEIPFLTPKLIITYLCIIARYDGQCRVISVSCDERIVNIGGELESLKGFVTRLP